MNNRLICILFLIHGLLIAALITRNGALALAVVPFMVYLAGSLLFTPQEVRLEAARTLSAASAQAGTPVQMQLSVENRGNETLYLQLWDPPDPGLKILEGERETCLALPEGESVAMDYAFLGSRGRYTWDNLRATVRDPFGLFEKQVDIPCSGRVQIFPVRIRLKHIPLNLQRTMQNPGIYPARRGGPGSAFWGVRQYHLGDPMRWIHWRLSARYPGSFFTKEFEREEPADIGLILDAGADLRVAGEASLFEYSANAAAALAELFLKEGNRVGMLNLSGGFRYLFPGSGKAQLASILRHMNRSGEGPNGSLEHLKYLPVSAFPSRSLIMVISPLSGQDLPAFRRLRAFGYQVLLLSPDPVRYEARSLPAGRATDLALQAARLERSLQLLRLRQMGVEVIEWQVDQPLAKVLQTAFRSRRSARGR
jgi:uncharacterized protein (DUF58 family)